MNPSPEANVPEFAFILRFLDYLDHERNFSAHTLRGYQADLRQFCQFWQGHGGVEAHNAVV